MGRHSAPRSLAPPTPAEPVKAGPRHAQSARSRQPASRPVVLGGPLAAATAHRHSALHRPAHHRAGLDRPALPNRPPLWRRSPAVPAAVAVLAVWSGANLPNVLSGSEARATSSEVERSTLAAGRGTLGGGVLAGSSKANGASKANSVSAAGDVSAAQDANTASAAARLTDRRVSRGTRTALGDSATAAVLKRPATVVKPAAAKPAKAVKPASRWVRPSAGGQSSCFCMRWGVMHDGIDLAGPNGSPIVAVGDGVVAEAGPAAGFGMWVAIRHSNGDYSIYGHMYQVYVTVGERVRAGQHIADIGANGHSTGPHLHFEITRGSATGSHLDPAVWLAERGVDVGPYNPDA